jgi:type II secretory pathway pseudopilin PulG
MKRKKNLGYTFAEVMVASGILGLAIGGSVRLVATMAMQEEASNDTAIALNLQDNAARLWQLGLTPAEVNNLLPIVTNNNDLAGAVTPTGTNSVTFGTAGTTTLANSMGTLENISCTINIPRLGTGTNRANVVQVYRPTIR